MEYGILGPLVVWRDGSEIPIVSARQRGILALLLLRRGEVVSTEALVEGVWGARPPATATKALRVHVSQLRKAVGGGAIETRSVGYALCVEPGAVDAGRFEELLAEGRRQLEDGEARRASEALRSALALWRGPALAELRDEEFTRGEIARLEELRLVALEHRLEADLALGRHSEVVSELESLVLTHRLRENLRRLQMLAYYRAGRQADALAAYQETRTVLRDELGLDPGARLRGLEVAILRHDPALDPAPLGPEATEPEPPDEPAVRRTGPSRRLALGSIAAVAIAAAVAIPFVVGSSTSRRPRGTAADAVGVFDPTTGRMTGLVTLTTAPSAVTSGAGSIWAVDVAGRRVSRIDPSKRLVIQTFQVGNGPDAIAFGGGSIWVANGLDGTVTQIDPQSDTIVDAAIPVGDDPTGIAVGAGDVWVANSSDSSVSRISIATGKALPPIAVPGGANGIAVGDDSAWVTGQQSGTVTRIDERNGSVLYPLHAGSGADAVAFGAGSVWVGNYLDGTVTRIDPSTEIGVTIPVGDGPDGIAFAGRSVWVSNELGGTLSRIDPGTSVAVTPTTTSGRAEGVAVGSRELFVGLGSAGKVHAGGTLRVSVAALAGVAPDPALTSGVLGPELSTLTNDGLTAFRKVGGGAGTEIVPDLAVALPIPTDGGLSYTFELRPGIRYSNGAVLSPADIRRGIERSVELADLGYSATYFSHIVGVERCLAEPKQPCDLSTGIVANAASNSVTFHLTSPDPDLLYELALPPAFAVPASTPVHPRGFVPATGPYEVASFHSMRSIRLVRNPMFHEWSPAAQPSGFPDAIVARPYASPAAAVADALSGSADLAANLSTSPPELRSLLTRNAARLEVNPWNITYELVLNTRIAPFDDVRARRALNFAIDRERLRDLTVGPGLGQVTCQILPPNFDGFRRYCPYTVTPRSSGVWTAPDMATARTLVRASGTAGQRVTVWMPSWLPFRKQALQYIVSVLDELGYRAGFRISHGNADDPYTHEDAFGVQIGFSGWFPDFASPAGDIPPGFTCASYNPNDVLNQNSAEFCDPALDREILQAESLQTSEPARASQLWATIDQDITRQAPWVAFANGVTIDVKSARVGNYVYNPQWGTLLDQLWLH